VSIKEALLCRGLFPETLPPCFSSEDCKRAFRGLSQRLSTRQFQKKRNAPPILYDGTKHDWNRRLYSTPHPIPYFYICEFIGTNWKTFEKQFKGSSYSISSIPAFIPMLFVGLLMAKRDVEMIVPTIQKITGSIGWTFSSKMHKAVRLAEFWLDLTLTGLSPSF
jgi:hypothetical protein